MRLLRRIQFILRHRRNAAELAEELEIHRQMLEQELRVGGLSPEEAHYAARRQLGNTARVGEEAREIWVPAWLENIAQDLRYAFRGMRMNPGISLGVILTLALGIGANAAMFSVVDALLLRPLPYDEPDEIVQLTMVTPPNEFGGPNIPYAVARGWQEAQDRPVMLHARATVLYTGGSEAQTLPVQGVTPEFGEVFGVAPVLGRGFLAEDAEPASADIALLDHAFWRSEFGGRSDVIGRTLSFNGIEHTIIGVMPEGFRFPTYATTEAWIPLRSDGVMLGRSAEGFYVEAVMRAPADVRPALGAQAETLGRALFEETTPGDGSTLGLQSLAEGRGGSTRGPMLLLSGAVGLILLLAGLNMVNLLLARGSARTDEMAIRIATGASRGRIIRQIGTEAMLLALLGGAAAVAVSLLLLRALQSIIPMSVTFWAPYVIAIDERTLLFTFLIAVASGLVFGLVPALKAADWARPIADAGLTRYATTTLHGRRLRNGLVVAEVGFSVLLLITASLLVNSFIRLMGEEPGLRLEQMAVLQFALSSTRYPAGAGRGAYLGRLEERIASLPGVESATLTAGLPPNTSFSFGLAPEVEGGTARPFPDAMLLPFTNVGSDFFDVTGARLLAGRPFLSAEDRAGGSVIIDEDLARHLWPEARQVVGSRFRLEPDAEWLTVVGVMDDMRLMGPDEREGEFSVLYPIGTYDRIGGQLAMAIRTRGDPRGVLNAIRAAVREVDPDQPIQELVPATTYWAQAVDMPRFLMLLMGILAALAVTLAAIGVHGVLAFGVAQRRHELGIRMVLGARAADLNRLVVGEGLVLAGVGIVLGISGALLTTGIVRGVLYGVEPVDPPTFIAAAAAVLIVTAAATIRPARRAARLDPADVLRA